MEGKYKLTLKINGNGFTDPIISDGKRIHVKFVKVMASFVFKHDYQSRKYIINGYTACKLQLEGRDEIFCATLSYGTDGKWYDWWLIQWHGFDESHAAGILGFFQLSHPSIDTNYQGTTVMAVVQSSPESLPMSIYWMSEEFISKFLMSENLDEYTYAVPIDSIVNPLCVFKNYGGGGTNREYFCTLPQRKWGCYFGDKI